MYINQFSHKSEDFNKGLINDDFFHNYLDNSVFYGYYYDHNERSYGISLHFHEGYSKINLFARECQENISVIEYKINSSDFSLEAISHDKVRITAYKFLVESIIPETLVITMPDQLIFTLHILTYNSCYIKFTESEKYASPIFLFRNGLVLSREVRKYENTAIDENVKTELFHS
jgi:hypothetical protein